MSIGRLPPEILFYVFDFATFVPGSFDVDPPDPFDQPHTFSKFQYSKEFPYDLKEDTRAVLPSLRLKGAVSRVCRQWHEIMQRLLYEILSFSWSPSVTRFCESFLKHADTLGNYVRRLDIKMGGWYTENDKIEASFTRLIQVLRRLEVSIILPSTGTRKSAYFNFRPVGIPLSIIHAFGSNCVFSLRKIAWKAPLRVDEHAHPEMSEFEGLFNLIENAANLRWVSVTPTLLDGHRTLAFNHLHASARSRSYVFPICVKSGDFENTLRNHTSFVSLPWSSEYLALGRSAIYTRNESCRDDITYFQWLDTSIHKLVCHFGGISNFRGRVTIPESITHFALICTSTKGQTRRHYRDIRTFLDWLQSDKPNVQVVRFLSPKFVEKLVEAHSARLLTERRRWRFRLEDHLGHLITRP